MIKEYTDYYGQQDRTTTKKPEEELGLVPVPAGRTVRG